MHVGQVRRDPQADEAEDRDRYAKSAVGHQVLLKRVNGVDDCRGVVQVVETIFWALSSSRAYEERRGAGDAGVVGGFLGCDELVGCLRVGLVCPGLVGVETINLAGNALEEGSVA